ncbi:MAG: metal-dependent hydrolase [Alphaproteobacteria bacterium]|nr:metal-dependent hydrolase [Alphaproteobacteria bacterium]
MDTVTQFALGAAVGTAVLGRQMGVRKAAIAGGLLGTLPDLDVYWPYADAVESYVLHRSVTHSLIVQTVVTPIFAEGLRLLFRALRAHRWRSYLAVFLCFATHALLDSVTIYGTQLFWPLSREPVGLGSVFIIDPLYTLPLIAAFLWAVIGNRWTPRFATMLTAALVVSTLYLGWSVVAQQITAVRAKEQLAKANIPADRLFATPTPFNTLFWRVVVLNGPRYYNLYIPLLGEEDAITAYQHARQPVSAECLQRNLYVKTVSAFTDGFYRFDAMGAAVVMSDLRMGLTPSYVFRFVVAEHGTAGRAGDVPRRVHSQRGAPGDLDWILDGVLGQRAIRPVEAAARIDLQRIETTIAMGETALTC